MQKDSFGYYLKNISNELVYKTSFSCLEIDFRQSCIKVKKVRSRSVHHNDLREKEKDQDQVHRHT